MSHVLVPSSGAESWKAFLAQPDLHWARGYSARTLAHCWEASALPGEVGALLEPPYGAIEPLLVIPERKTPLPGGSRESQSDVFLLARHREGLVACTIEGKVDEPFGPTVAQQMEQASPGKAERLAFCYATLGIADCPPTIHYQLLHRTAAALIEAERFATRDAAMIVHSFSPEHRWFDAFAAFASLLGLKLDSPGQAGTIDTPSGKRLLIGWASGDQDFREM